MRRVQMLTVQDCGRSAYLFYQAFRSAGFPPARASRAVDALLSSVVPELDQADEIGEPIEWHPPYEGDACPRAARPRGPPRGGGAAPPPGGAPAEGGAPRPPRPRRLRVVARPARPREHYGRPAPRDPGGRSPRHDGPPLRVPGRDRLF